ncbi:MAG: restriction endonuclease subunit S, partial [Planctomycetia bacterium]|nr:restriction endonuclease subunit S [Planctomycetia bacterium]
MQELIAELCPDGVEWRKLCSVTQILYGYPADSKSFTEDCLYIPLIRIRDVVRGYSETFYKGDYPPEYVIHKGDILVGMDGEFNLNRWNDRNALLNQRVLRIQSNDEAVVLNSFLFHLLSPVFKKLELSIQGSTVKHLSAKAINTILIPIPPLPIQAEIVRILDAFTELTA